MKDEIKEILDKWKCYIELTKKFTTNEYEMLRVEDIDKILDYITNLQEENERLKIDNKRLQHNEKVFKSRNEKAIEYIYEHREEALFEDNNGKLVYALSDNFDEGDLLNILQGENKE